jgi:O-6-methylguanine DNA methyltransferase
MTDDDDAITARLAALAHDGPHDTLDRIAAHWTRTPSPIGDLYIASTDHGISYLRTSEAVHEDDAEFAAMFRERFAQPLLVGTHPPIGLGPALLEHDASRLRYDLRQLSAFEREVALAVMRIPRGQVRPYAWVAHQIGLPKAARSVGSVLANNPVPILIPCHRVIKSDGTLGEYVFTPTVKRALLDAEGANIGEVYELARHNVHYVGSDTTGVLCFPTCMTGRAIGRTDLRGFGTVAEATAAGYRPCGQCLPAPTNDNPAEED